MRHSIPAVKKYMTPSPLSIGPDETLERAHELMRTNRIHHLPVLRGGRLVGIISERDVLLVETLRDVDPSRAPVEDAMSEHVYEVDADTGLDVVAEMLTEYNYGSAVVLERGELVGIFTTNDASRALADLLHAQTV
jgi:acetoin utilization protein AcuB